jgi:hypothetical protein
MTTLILLSADDADAVRGPSATVEGAALWPIVLTDGRYILSTRVLADAAHAAHRERLAALPTADETDVAALLAGSDE